MAFENPTYKVLKREGHFELRRYGDYIVAEVEVAADYDAAFSSGFRILADYIFGNNRKSEHIAMTAPVTGQASEGSMTEKTAHSRESELLTWMRQHGLESVAVPLFANYSPPWIPPFLRRNEVIFALDTSEAD